MNLDVLDFGEARRLRYEWTMHTEYLLDGIFNWDAFQITAQKTCCLLAKVFDLRDSDPDLHEYALPIPKEIVGLLLCIHSFAESEYIDHASLVALFVAETLCDINNCCGISYPSPETNPDEWQFKVWGDTNSHVIDTDTFDLSELVNDVQDPLN